MINQPRAMLDFYVLGQSPKGAEGWPHPVTISVHPRGSTTVLNFSVGSHAANVGGQLPITRIIVDGEFDESFAEEFDACDARWLVPYLARLESGEDVTIDELTGAYRAKFGRWPRIEGVVDEGL